MDSSTENSVRESGVIVKTKLPAALPLLPRGKLYSQAPKSIVEFVSGYTGPTKQTEPSELAAPPEQLPRRSPLPFQRLSQLLQDKRRILYNIMGQDENTTSDNSFGFQYYEKEPDRLQYLEVQDTGKPRLLSFESRFQSGNLLLAYEYTPEHYLLVIRPDYNTISYCQWFYFQVENETAETLTVTFEIVNMTKSHSLFSRGMKIMAKTNDEWFRTGEEIRYQQNEFTRFPGLQYRSLKWKSKIHPRQNIRFAYSQPYTYSDLNTYLDVAEQNPLVRRTILCRTMLKNRVDQLTISSGSNQTKKVIVMLGRTHPAQTVGSFVMRGVIDFLISDKAEAKLLRQKFIFKIIPLVNPDGVIIGNSRCSLKGVDLNRCWQKPHQRSDPQIYHIKRLIMHSARSDRFVMFCDLHGHSKKKNIFVYGCHDRSQPLASRQLPFILSKLDNSFSYQDCNFRVDPTKEGTARVCLWKKLRIPNIFTLQSSFCSGSKSAMHLDEKGYKQMGQNLCKAINIYFTNKSQGKTFGIQAEQTQRLMKELKEQLTKELHSDKALAKSGMQQTSGSQSEQENSKVYDSVAMKKGQKTRPLEYAEDYNLTHQLNTERPVELKTYRKNRSRKLQDVAQTHSLRRQPSSSKYLKKPTNRSSQKNAISYQQPTDRCVTQNIISEYRSNKYRQQKPKPQPLNLNRQSIKADSTSSSKLRSEKRIVEKFVPQFINFNFEQKFSRTTLQSQLRSKLARRQREQMEQDRFAGVIEHRKQVKKSEVQNYILWELEKRRKAGIELIKRRNYL